MTRAIWTVGHSNHAIEHFLDLLKAPAIRQVVDVRRFPGSRRHPQFQREALERRLGEAGIAYRHLEELGGRRSERAPGSANTGWRVEAFNAYADYMGSPVFLIALAELERLSSTEATAMMCSEALPWRCHRRLISDSLIVRGWTVWDIMTAAKVEPHKLTEFARVDGDRLTYPATPLFTSDDPFDHSESTKGG